jgi:hypothetical protein
LTTSLKESKYNLSLVFIAHLAGLIATPTLPVTPVFLGHFSFKQSHLSPEPEDSLRENRRFKTAVVNLTGRTAREYGLEFAADFRGRLLSVREDRFGG